MKISSHTIIVEDYPSRGEHLVYSTRTQFLGKIDERLRDVLKNLGSENYFLDSEDKNNLAQLYRRGVLVRDKEEEQQKLKEHLRQIKHGYSRSKLVVTILTTYACNFKCTYCFEESSRENIKLSFETQEHVISWLKGQMKQFGYQSLNINYYGGEPLLNQPAIDNISSVMKTWCEERQIGFAMSIQTNGYLLTPEIVERYKKLNLISIRISVDGVGEDHDKNRPLRGGGGTFERIIQNICDCVDLIYIGISIGFEGGDVKPIERLLNHFDDLGILHKLGRIIYSPINPTLGGKGQPQAIRSSDCMCNSEDAVFSRSVKRINELLDQKGIPEKTSGMSTSVCPLTRENGGVTIDQEGRLYKCNSLLGHPEFAVGDVRQDKFNETGNEFRDLDVWKQCPTDCTYLPMCSGGCRLMSFVGGHKNFRVPSCKKVYMNEMAPEFIKRDYDRLVENSRKQMKGESRPQLVKSASIK